jgi:hypothetical protein
LSGADAKCLTDLTTNTGWKGYADANTRGILTSGKVHAFLCEDGAPSGCNNLNASTIYYFADANNGSNGGASFTTNGNGVGPNDSADWSAADHFGSSYSYWAVRASGTSTAWGTTYAFTGNSCANSWNTGTNAVSGKIGASGNTDSTRWQAGGLPTCDNTEHLICYVNP